MRILVTGGGGFLGRRFAERARPAGHTVITADIQGRVDDHCDMGDTAAVGALVAETRPDTIVHLAALLTDTCAADPVAAARINILGTAAVFAAARQAGVGRVVYASSV